MTKRNENFTKILILKLKQLLELKKYEFVEVFTYFESVF